MSHLQPYRGVLALPGVRPLLLSSMLARIPMTATSITVTLYVVLELDRGYAAAGLVSAVLTIGRAVGGPVLGRFVDRQGLRPALVITAIGTAAFWGLAPLLPYGALLGVSLLGGVLTLPVFSVVRQSLAALVPAEQRRPAYALDSMTVEVSYMVGPAAAVLLVTVVSATAAMVAIGAGMVLAGALLFILNPPVRASHEEPLADAVPLRRRDWLTRPLLAVLAISAATTFVLGGTDVSMVAVLREADELRWTALVVGAWGGASLLGGFVYGALPRSPSATIMAGLLCLLTIPIGVIGTHWWLLGLALLPAGVLCAPALAATADGVSRLAPPSARGEAMGLHGSALTVGIALGAPLAGWVIDAGGPPWGFAAAGTVGLLIVVFTSPTVLRRRRHAQPPPTVLVSASG